MGATAHRKLPLGSTAPGPSFVPCGMLLDVGKSGPASQVPGSAGFAGAVYSAVLPVAPTKKQRPSGSSAAGPISEDSTSTITSTVWPADTHVLVSGRYFWALRLLSVRTVRTVSSASSAQLSSELPPGLLGPACQLSGPGVKIAVWDVSSLPMITRPSSSTQNAGSPISFQPGVARSLQLSVSGSYISPVF